MLLKFSSIVQIQHFHHAFIADKLSEAEELAQLSVQEAESLKNRILGLEERLEFSQTSPTTPLILPPPASRNISSSGNSSQSLLGEKTSIESLTPPTSLDADAAEPINAGVNDTAISTSRTLNAADAHDAPSHVERNANTITKEAELIALKDSVKKLQEKLTQSQQECSALQERELKLQQTIEREDQNTTKDVSLVRLHNLLLIKVCL